MENLTMGEFLLIVAVLFVLSQLVGLAAIYVGR